MKPTADPYFTHYDPREEHDAYKKAERRFEDHHRAKVSKVSHIFASFLFYNLYGIWNS